MIIRKRVAESFLDSGKTHDQIAKESGMSREYVRSFAAGEMTNPTVQSITNLAKALGEKNPGWWCWRNQERQR